MSSIPVIDSKHVLRLEFFMGSQATVSCGYFAELPDKVFRTVSSASLDSTAQKMVKSKLLVAGRARNRNKLSPTGSPKKNCGLVISSSRNSLSRKL